MKRLESKKEMITSLIEKGADPNFLDNDGNSPLDSAEKAERELIN